MARTVHFALLVFVVAVVVSVAGIAYEVAEKSPTIAVTESLRLAITGIGTPGQFSISPIWMAGPAGSILTLTIINNDPVNHSPPANFSYVRGTAGGGIVWTEGGSDPSQEAGGIPMDAISHTFTMIGGGYNLNVPIPIAANSNSPSSITFSIQLLSADQLTWECVTWLHGNPSPYQTPMTGTLWVS
jgi:hypothetical protein